MITECNVLDNNPSFFLTKSNRNLMYQDAKVLSRLEMCFVRVKWESVVCTALQSGDGRISVALRGYKINSPSHTN